MNCPKLLGFFWLSVSLLLMLVIFSACTNDVGSEEEEEITDSPTSYVTSTVTRTSTPLSSQDSDAHNKTTTPEPNTTDELELKVILNSINVRSGPGVDHEPISTLMKNDVVSVFSTNEDETWYEVDLGNGSTGWVGSTVVEIIEGQTALASLDQSPTLTPARDGAILRVVLSSVNIRSGPGTNYSIKGNLNHDETVKVIARTESGEWYNVKLDNGQTGWLGARVTEPLNQQAFLQVPIAVTIPASPENVNTSSSSSSSSSSSQACCRVCTTGKACGNSCINRNYTCHQPPGCACNASSP